MIFKLLGLKKKKRIASNHINLEAIKKSPLDCLLHFDLANQYFNAGNFYAAWAELRTADYLGLDKNIVVETSPKFKAQLPNLTEMNHNQYFRFKTLCDAINNKLSKIEGVPTILDIGGGFGELAAFIPECKYCLVEPDVNGINGLTLPFENESFDLVVSCHVLEHIPFKDRDTFLDQLISKAKKGVILLNPIHVKETLPQEGSQLYVDITESRWAKEHLECGMPTIDSVKEYAKKRNLKFEYTPNGSAATTMALVFLDYISNELDTEKYKQINAFFNTKYIDILDSEKYPNAGLFFLGKA